MRFLQAYSRLGAELMAQELTKPSVTRDIPLLTGQSGGREDELPGTFLTGKSPAQHLHFPLTSTFGGRSQSRGRGVCVCVCTSTRALGSLVSPACRGAVTDTRWFLVSGPFLSCPPARPHTTPESTLPLVLAFAVRVGRWGCPTKETVF